MRVASDFKEHAKVSTVLRLLHFCSGDLGVITPCLILFPPQDHSGIAISGGGGFGGHFV